MFSSSSSPHAPALQRGSAREGEPCRGEVEKAAGDQESPTDFLDQLKGEQTTGDPRLPNQGHVLVFSRLVFVVVTLLDSLSVPPSSLKCSG